MIALILAAVVVISLSGELNTCPGKRKHEWKCVGTKIYPVKYTEYVCKNCGKVKYE